jgi:hypothetical protein
METVCFFSENVEASELQKEACFGIVFLLIAFFSVPKTITITIVVLVTWCVCGLMHDGSDRKSLIGLGNVRWIHARPRIAFRSAIDALQRVTIGGVAAFVTIVGGIGSPCYYLYFNPKAVSCVQRRTLEDESSKKFTPNLASNHQKHRKV